MLSIFSGLSNSMMVDSGHGGIGGANGSGGHCMNPNQSFYSNLAPSAIGGQAIMTTPLLLGQPATSAAHASVMSAPICSAPSPFTHPTALSSSSMSSAHSDIHSTSKASAINAKTTGRKFACKMCHQVRVWRLPINQLIIQLANQPN